MNMLVYQEGNKYYIQKYKLIVYFFKKGRIKNWKIIVKVSSISKEMSRGPGIEARLMQKYFAL